MEMRRKLPLAFRNWGNGELRSLRVILYLGYLGVILLQEIVVCNNLRHIEGKMGLNGIDIERYFE
jgi:hypothetical protein